jgi:hypothetical protein
MTIAAIALVVVLWFILLVLCLGLAQAAARGDRLIARALAVERERRVEPERRHVRAA